MSADAEKVISLSLCKIAETRGTRRGGNSLHKHLLIASVLSKATRARARTAFLDTWYMGDETDGTIDLNLSYQEHGFSADELDSNAGESSTLDIDPAIVEQITGGTNVSSSTRECNSILLGDPRFGSDSEGEIDLPPDILHCVEKLGGLNERIFGSQSASSSCNDGESGDHSSKDRTSVLFVPSPTTVAIPDIISSSPRAVSAAAVAADDDINEESQQLTTTLTYLDLDAGSSIVERGPVLTSSSALGKRRREWCLDDDDEDGYGSGSDLYVSKAEKLQTSVNTTANISTPSFSIRNCKRLRFDDSGVSSPEKTDGEDETGVPSKCADGSSDKEGEVCNSLSKAGSFRLSYEDVDGDDSDDDSFLEDALNQGLQSPSQTIEMPNNTRHRNDRRVPSASSSGSCSDEDGEGESSMEVDQITNLVQFISFNKQQQQSQSQNAANLRSISCVN